MSFEIKAQLIKEVNVPILHEWEASFNQGTTTAINPRTARRVIPIAESQLIDSGD
jgi:hypothetical protein